MGPAMKPRSGDPSAGQPAPARAAGGRDELERARRGWILACVRLRTPLIPSPQSRAAAPEGERVSTRRGCRPHLGGRGGLVKRGGVSAPGGAVFGRVQGNSPVSRRVAIRTHYAMLLSQRGARLSFPRPLAHNVPYGHPVSVPLPERRQSAAPPARSLLGQVRVFAHTMRMLVVRQPGSDAGRLCIHNRHASRPGVAGA